MLFLFQLKMASFSARLSSPMSKVAAAMLAGSGVAAYMYGTQNSQSARCWTSTAHLKYPASSNYPDLSQHNNIMADILTPGVSIQNY